MVLKEVKHWFCNAYTWSQVEQRVKQVEFSFERIRMHRNITKNRVCIISTLVKTCGKSFLTSNGTKYRSIINFLVGFLCCMMHCCCYGKGNALIVTVPCWKWWSQCPRNVTRASLLFGCWVSCASWSGHLWVQGLQQNDCCFQQGYLFSYLISNANQNWRTECV